MARQARMRAWSVAAASIVSALVAVALIVPAGGAWAAQPEPDTGYLKATHQSNLMVMEAGRDAKANGRSDCVRRAGAIMEADHRKLDAQALQVVGRLGVELPTEPTAFQRRTLTSVKSKAGTADYDAAWLRAQEDEHRYILRLIDSELSGGRDASVQALARGARPVVQMHLDMVQDGRCRISSGPSTVGAGDGGQAAAAERLRRLGGAGLLVVGLLLVAVGAVTAVRRRSSGGPA